MNLNPAAERACNEFREDVIPGISFIGKNIIRK